MRAGSLLVLSLFLSPPSPASDPPDSPPDPRTGLVRILDGALSGHGDRSPHLAIDGNGVVHVVWQREEAAPQIRAITIGADGTPGSERLLSDPGEDSRSPVIALSGSMPWVAYEIHDGSAVSVAVQPITDDPDPIGPRIVVGATTFSGDADARIHAVDGHLWTTWRDRADVLAYSVYDATLERWSGAEYEDAGDGDLATALLRVEEAVLRR